MKKFVKRVVRSVIGRVQLRAARKKQAIVRAKITRQIARRERVKEIKAEVPKLEERLDSLMAKYGDTETFQTIAKAEVDLFLKEQQANTDTLNAFLRSYNVGSLGSIKRIMNQRKK